MILGRANDRSGLRTLVYTVVFGFVFFVFLAGAGYKNEWYDAEQLKLYKLGSSAAYAAEDASGVPISYQLNRPPTTGCEEIVEKLRLRLLESYSVMLQGIRHANIWGFLETENKGDPAIWTAQQILLTTLGVQTHVSCRFMDKECDLQGFNDTLTKYAPHAAIIMAGGGNFNDYFWGDQPSRITMVDNYPEVPIRAFPQSVYMTKEDRIEMTKKSFGAHPDLQVAARDLPSWQWLDQNLEKKVGTTSVLVPDVAFAWGNRPDLRLNTKKTHDLLILARADREVSSGNSDIIKFGHGTLDMGGTVGNITYNKVDWRYTHTPGIDTELDPMLRNRKDWAPSPRPTISEAAANQTLDYIKYEKLDYGTVEQRTRGADLMYTEFVKPQEMSHDARSWARSIAGFQLLGSARFVITDRLHGHIMSTIIGTPHVLMDSKLGKNLYFHDTWTQDCKCVRIAQNFTQALDVARLYFESGAK